MKIINKKIDYLNASIPSIYLKLGLPILISSVVGVFVSILQTKVISIFCPEYFAVSAVLGNITSILIGIGTSIASASWMKCAASFAGKDTDSKRNLFSVTVLIVLCQFVVESLALIFTDPILKLINTPIEIYQDVRRFYIIYISISFFSAFSAFATTLIAGLTTPISILLMNIASQAFPCLVAILFLGVFKMELVGGALLVGVGAAMAAVLSFIILLKTKRCEMPTKSDRVFDKSLCLSILKKAAVLILQQLCCSIGYLVVTAQTNKLLSLDYISVLTISVPISTAFAVFSTVSTVALPQNYLAGKYRRTQKILLTSVAFAQLYGLACFAFFAIAGRAYYASLFADYAVVEMGAEYWFYQGFGYIMLPTLFVVRDFFVVANKPMITLGAGICELLGNLICAFVLIPLFGNIGRSLSQAIGWGAAAVYIWIAYFALKKRGWLKTKEKAVF